MKKNKLDGSLFLIVLTVFVGTSILSILIVSLVYQFSLLKEIRNQKASENEIALFYNTLYIDKTLESELNLIVNVQKFIETNPMLTLDELQDYFNEVQSSSPFLLGIDVVNVDGKIDYTYPYDEFAIGFSRNDFITDANLDAEGAYAWLKPRIAPLKTNIEISIVYRGAQRYFIGYFSIEIFEETYVGIETDSIDKGLLILDRNGIIIFDSGSDNDLFQRKIPNFSTLKAYSEQELSSHPFVINDIDSYISVTKSSWVDWYIIVYETELSATYLARSSLKTLIVLLILSLSIFSSSLLILTRITTKNLDRLSTAFQVIRKGQYGHTLDTMILKDFRKLAEEFNVLSASLFESNSKLENIAYYDQLTGLHSRNYLKMFFEDNVAQSSDRWIFVYIDIRKMKLINDSFGYMNGDKIIINIGSRLKNLFDESVVARIGSDEYLTIVKSKDATTVAELISRLREASREPIRIEQLEFTISLRVGFSTYPEDGNGFETLFGNAAIALEVAQELEGNYYGVYQPTLSKDYQRRIELEISLDHAISKNEFHPVFQPIVFTKTKKIRGFEALSRWSHPFLGRIMPNEYIPLLEQTSKIIHHDFHIMKESFEFLRKLASMYKKRYVMSVNLSAKTIMSPDFVPFVLEETKRNGLDTSLIEFEITEQVLIQDVNYVKDIIEKMRGFGYKFSEDDFGDGFSSLTYLSHLKFDTVKISRSFLFDIEKNDKKRIMIANIIKLTSELGFSTVVEGVETESVFHIINEMKADYIQGYLFFKPKSEKEILEILEAEQATEIENR